MGRMSSMYLMCSTYLVLQKSKETSTYIYYYTDEETEAQNGRMICPVVTEMVGVSARLQTHLRCTL